MVTYVTYKDYLGIKNSFNDEEIKLKYGQLIIKSEEDYRKMMIEKRN